MLLNEISCCDLIRNTRFLLSAVDSKKIDFLILFQSRKPLQQDFLCVLLSLDVRTAQLVCMKGSVFHFKGFSLTS